MPDDNQRLLPILGYGENLIEPVRPGSGGGEVTYPRSYSEARNRVKKQVSTLINSVKQIPSEKRLDEVVVTIRLNHKFLAKSYTPNTLFRDINVENVGSRRWFYSENDESNQVNYSKMHFIKATQENLTKLEELLDQNEVATKEAFKKDIQKIEDISLLSPEEIIVGFDDNWEQGKVEMILHPFEGDTDEAVEKFIKILNENGVQTDSLRIKSYANGPTFISGNLNRRALQAINDFNPLRTVHPINIRSFPEMRTIRIDPNAPEPYRGNSRSSIKIGMFDGGVDTTNPLLINHVTENNVLDTEPLSEGIAHGTAVAGCILYGPLNAYGKTAQVPQPLVSVESFRVLPLNDPTDYELYEAIDIIESIVPSRHDISVYNLSFGPNGPILDDDISRFTYVLDDLAWNYRKLFVVAVGNDGDLASPLNRIQSPADIVNGLGVGAFSYDYSSGEVIRASYSSIGQGREGCKVKPDVVGFGGDENRPIHLVSSVHGQKQLSMGTSFATPIITGMAGELLGRCDRFDPLVARALLIHSANNPKDVCNELGYGFIDQTVDQIMHCTDKHVTLVYSSSILPANYAKLPIPYPINAKDAGTLEIKYTIAVLSKASPLHVEDYTESAIEDTFYPHDKKYRFTLNNKNYVRHVVEDAEEIQSLMDRGALRSTLPVTRSTRSYQTEQARRGELKWDTVVQKWDKMRATSLENPFLVLHGMGRNSGNSRMDYAVIATISAPRYQGSLYEDILNEYKQLQPVQMRAINEILIPIS
ncbi:MULTISPECIES: S8 family peptidase [unclassified Paenibacillus]|uniref:S8 family peptidase n=1 Tax=unclassified Paenibacillus TaxID=185978 RepID=UPI002405E80B|nr:MULTISPECIES: S8 family peptidase [unclassified Paenibacillus]MDF9841946.1 subtilisin family serine protease [Paenibacillus sp. PastF-2]MDF9848373.1 subtilisin family serine protease [Paenibacillus sp. PastM-2]MDF9855106.1 subtilisin family serine protease [Paenibacillus sp. PastF-1]MDH6480375.1 subtilisin family serine protease [Paenibacillus sp. PastH-2]MDH6507641.1 subtilisin family serine protease [Paenibacillus sp. PastM-3]